ncbi:MAG: MBL fold metallo-hydrolase [Cyclobacteriaceae bacterium]|nr:MBL fold metallo-hydrolase [Cyclobacteriaceae bacterium]
MKTYSFILLLMISSMAIAQRSAPDQIETKKGPLLIQPILHGTVMFTWDGKTIYVDPYGGAKAFEGISAPDLILITDIHGDHMSVETLEGIETSNAIIIAPSAVTEKLPDNLKAQTTSLDNGKKIEKLGISITALPMYNLPEDSESRHTKGRGNGYVLNIGGKNIYLSGDTEDIPEMRALKNIDVAFVCMNLPYTMDIDQASSAVLDFKPKTVYPYHYRGQGGLADVEAFQKKVQGANNKIEVRLRNWYPSYE